MTPNHRQTVAVVQARMGSTRLPGKSLKEVAGRPLLEYVVRRTALVFPDPILAIPRTRDDDPIREQADTWPCRIFRGDHEDVLTRIFNALCLEPSASFVVRVTGDNPLISTWILDQLPSRMNNDAWTAGRYFPLGTGPALFKREWIERAHRESTSPTDREHVTTWIKRHPDATAHRWSVKRTLRAPGFRLTVDTPEDLSLIREIYGHFDGTIDVSLDRVIQFLDERPRLIRMNAPPKRRDENPPTRILFCLNRGNHWGKGHWYRHNLLRTSLNDHRKHNFQPFSLVGQIDEDEPLECLFRANDPLTAEQIQRWSRRTQPLVVILDHKQTRAPLVRTLQNEGGLVVGVEDRGEGRHRMDAVVDPNLYEDTLEEDEVPEERRYYGPEYAMIDPAYRDHQLQEPPGNTGEVGLCFGGTDPEGIAPLFVREIAPRFEEVEFHLFGTEPEIKPPENITLDGFVEDAPERFSSMDFMVISGGVLKFEMACLRMPSMILAQNEEQYENSRRFVENNGLHWPVFPPGEDVAAWAEALFEATQPRALQASFRSTEGVVDGNGIQRVLKILKELIDT